MYVVSVIATVIISIDSIRSAIIDLILKLLESVGVDVSGIKKKRQDAKDAVAAYNEKNNTNISIEEYNNIMGYKSVQQKEKKELLTPGQQLGVMTLEQRMTLKIKLLKLNWIIKI